MGLLSKYRKENTWFSLKGESIFFLYLIDIYKKHKDDEYEMKKVAKDAAEIFDEIKKIRKDDLEKYGREMCDGNIIFKALRRSDYIGKLIKLKDLTYDKINSL